MSDETIWAEANGRVADPMKEEEAKVRGVDTPEYENTFKMYLENRVYPHDHSEDTFRWYRLALDQWCEFIEDRDRHPATPPRGSALEFAQALRDERGNTKDTIVRKVKIIRGAFRYFNTAGQNGEPLIYEKGLAFSEFETVLDAVALESKKEKPIHQIPVETLGELFDEEILNIRDRAIILIMLKLGLRAGEVCNIKISDLDIRRTEVREHFSEMGSHPFIGMEEAENCIYIPPRSERDGNKSKNGRLMPIDDELRMVLVQYLLPRPDSGEPWLFLSKTSGSQMHKSNVNEIWKKYFRPAYGETEYRRAVTSHFGRHYFTTFWEQSAEMDARDIQYMRGDGKERDDDGGFKKADSMDVYVHRFYSDIADTYSKEVFKIRTVRSL